MPGYGEYCDLFGSYFEKFAKAGYRVFGFDRRGFGKTEGVRGDIGNRVLEDCIEFIQLEVESKNLHGQRKFLYGISMGALLSSRIALELPNYFDGVILTVPWLDNHSRIRVGKRTRLLLWLCSLFCRNRETPGSSDDAFDEKQVFYDYRLNRLPLYTRPMQMHCLHFGLKL